MPDIGLRSKCNFSWEQGSGFGDETPIKNFLFLGS